PIDAAFAAPIDTPTRRQALAAASPNLSAASLSTLQGLTAVEWTNLRTEMARVLDSAQRAEVRDSSLDDGRAQLFTRFAARFPLDQRTLAAEIIAPFLVANSTYDADQTQQAREDAAARVDPVRFNVIKGQVVVREGELIDDLLYERLQALDL